MTNTYTVKKLIEELKKMPQHDYVWVTDEDKSSVFLKNVSIIQKVTKWINPDDENKSEVTIHIKQIQA